ncbi:SAM-dependent chlorinase/fluorinase [Candidatus Woesearchaeota archaeon]|nr:SAM-dependent chlorinase/fluorinase [Candidatus Woesearchaeota archaeon]
MIATLTDFMDSEYLGVMKGVIYSIAPKAIITDLYKKVKPQNIEEGAWILLTTYKYFPKGTIFLCVVDPGVGGKRDCLAVKTKNYYFVGPDNGIFYPTVQEDKVEKVVQLATIEAAPTFHGRDVFAKAAGKLEKSIPIEKLGKPGKIKVKEEFYLQGRTGEIVRIDEYGNIITNLPHIGKKEYLAKTRTYEQRIQFYETYEEAPSNQLFLIQGSANTLEISLKNGKAIDLWDVDTKARITIE